MEVNPNSVLHVKLSFVLVKTCTEYFIIKLDVICY